MKQTKQDRRSRRTRQLVLSAITELLQEKRYETITVRDILDRAGIGSSTFYTHFFDKEDVQASLMEQMLDHVVQSSAPHETSSQELVPTLQLFRHFQEHAQQIQSLTGGREGGKVWEMMQTTLSRSIEYSLRDGPAEKRPLTIPPEAIAHYLSGAFLTLLRWWLSADLRYSPERMAEIYRQLVLPGRWAVTDSPAGE